VISNFACASAQSNAETGRKVRVCVKAVRHEKLRDEGEKCGDADWRDASSEPFSPEKNRLRKGENSMAYSRLTG